MNRDQETLMRTLHNHGVCMGKTKAFALYSSSNSFQLVQSGLDNLDKLYWVLDDVQPEDSDVDVFDLQEYKEKTELVVSNFNEIYQKEITIDQYNFICKDLNPKYLIA